MSRISTERLNAVAQNRHPEAIKIAIIQAVMAGKSYAEAAAEFGTTKGIVSGIAYRAAKAMGVERLATSKVVQRAAPAKPKPAPVLLRAKPQASTSPDENWQPKPIAFLDIRDGQCRFPLWKAHEPFSSKFFCGLPTIDAGKPYCAHCTRKTNASPRQTKQLDDKLGVTAARKAA